MPLPKRILGKTGVEVTAFGLGGEGILRTHGRFRDAEAVIRRAIDLGVTYFESARAYAGSEEYLGRSLGPARDRVFLATKTHARRARAARAHLDESLALLRTDGVDLWYFHDIRSEDDLLTIAGPGGALEVALKARDKGEVRFLGVSGHEDPSLLVRAMDLLPVDVVLCPVNPAEAAFRGFPDTAVAEAARRGLGVVAMKTLCRGLVGQVPGAPGPEAFLRYALSTPGVQVASVGCDSPEQVEANVRAVEAAASLPGDQREHLEQLCYPFAPRLAYYRPGG
ncbi:aldo/keto reductase [Deferrisoma palaeochoriense]